MLHRSLAVALVALALALLVSQPGFAEDKNAKTHEGKIVKVEGNKLTMTDKDGKNEHTHNVPATAKITCDGRECRLDDLKAGYFVKVTTKEDERTVTKVEARTKEKK
jgi:hypothetical protein